MLWSAQVFGAALLSFALGLQGIGPPELPDLQGAGVPVQPPAAQPAPTPPTTSAPEPPEPAPEAPGAEPEQPDAPLEDNPDWDELDDPAPVPVPTTGAAPPAAASPEVQRAGPPVTKTPAASPPAPRSTPDPAAVSAAAPAAVSAAAPAPAPASAPVPATGDPLAEGPSPDGAESAAESPEAPAAEDKNKPRQKLGGFKLFRAGLVAHVGYFDGTSQRNGLFDRDKSIQNSIDNGMVDPVGGGDLGETKFGGGAFGGTLDLELLGINIWLDMHKFFGPGGMWALLLGYDHEIGFNHWLRLDVGAGFGMSKVFLGDALGQLYVDPDDPAKTDIARTGIEGRAMADLQFRLFGPVFTGPGVLLGYHYLWSADASEVVKEKGLHYAVQWNLRFDFAVRKKKKPKR